MVVEEKHYTPHNLPACSNGERCRRIEDLVGKKGGQLEKRHGQMSDDLKYDVARRAIERLEADNKALKKRVIDLEERRHQMLLRLYDLKKMVKRLDAVA